jgi:polar amino acid transport system substrate-binding protein
LSGYAAPDAELSHSGTQDAVESAKVFVHSSAGQLETIRSQDALRVGVSIFVPWVMHDNKDKLIGYEVDVARKLAADMGVRVEFVETSWGSIITGLLADEYDLIISGLSLTPKRALLINFSEPYSHSSSVLIASRKLAGKMKNKEQYNSKDITMGVVRGSIGEKLLGQDFPMATLKVFDSESQTIAALLSGKIYAMMTSTPKTGYLLNRHTEEVFQPFSQPFSVHAEGFGVLKGDADFLNFLNTWILYNTQNGWLSKRHHYWFDTIEWVDQLQAAKDK